jgi:hypothetical protein
MFKVLLHLRLKKQLKKYLTKLIKINPVLLITAVLLSVNIEFLISSMNLSTSLTQAKL